MRLDFSVYRKETFTGVSISNNSLHPRQHKFVAINAAIHRLLLLPLSAKARENEIRKIEHIAAVNDLNADVPMMVRRESLRLLLSESREPTHSQPDTFRKRWLRLPYLGKPFNELSCELKKYGYWVGFYPATILSKLVCLKDKIPADQKSGIYRQACGECDSQYIGQTGRAFKECFSEHRTAYTSNKPHQSAMAKHCLDPHLTHHPQHESL